MAGNDIDDTLTRIEQLIAEERELRAQATGTGLSDNEQKRLKNLQQRLDQYWDLLRRRRASAEFGGNPDQVEPRPVSEVESYRQ